MIELHEGLEIREIPRFPHYFAREEGSVWTLWYKRWRAQPQRDWKLGEEFHSCVTVYNKASDRLVVSMYGVQPYLHHVMLEAFVGPKPPGLECCHYDGDETNCSIQNLRWDTHSSNELDKRRCGTSNQGGRHWRALFHDSDALRILQRHAAGDDITRLAEEYNVLPIVIYKLVRRQSYTHLVFP